MEFTVPQFIEKEPRIVGPLTFKQLAFVLAAAAICIFFYFTVPFPIFIILAAIIIGLGFSLAFLKVNGTVMPVILKNVFIFAFKPRIYLWGKGRQGDLIYKETYLKIEEKKEKRSARPSPKVSEKSQLNNLLTRINTSK